MNLSFPWARYSKKLAAKIENPTCAGFFSEEEAAKKQMRLAMGREGDAESGNLVVISCLVDESDGVIADAKFQVFGQSALIGAAEVACTLILRKNYDQASRLTADLLDKQVRDKSDLPAFPEETSSHLNLVLFAIEEMARQCMDIPIADVYLAPPMAPDITEGGLYPGWEALSHPQKIAVIEQVIHNDIRPYIELDAGGIQIVSLEKNDRELIIAYQGSCTSCHSATGATLTAIQQILRTKVHPDIVVTPDASFLMQ